MGQQELDIIEKLADVLKNVTKDKSHHHKHHKHYATHFLLTISYNGLKITSNKMSVSILDTQSVVYTLTPVDANGNASTVAPGSVIVSSSDTTLFTVTPDPSNQLSGTITGVPSAVGSGSLNVSANADPTGATTVTITGSDVVAVNQPVPPPSLAVGFTFSYGTPQAKK